MRDGRQHVVILYSHPLLGEGLGRLLAGDPELLVELVPVDELDAAERALGGCPDVVILERTPPLQAIDLMRLAPSALLIDVGLDAGPSWAYRRDELSSQPDALLRAIHERESSADHDGAGVVASNPAPPTAQPAAAAAAPAKPGVVRAPTALRSVGA